ncbi:MAG: Glucodextranase, domain [Candidatus Parcubacteria bacterium]
MEVRGTIAHAKEATINGMNISFAKNGDFVALLVLTPPLDTIDIWAKNAYGRESTKSIQVAVVE